MASLDENRSTVSGREECENLTDDCPYELRLYVAGQTPRSLEAFGNLKKICDEHLKGRYTIEVIDLLENPQAGKGRPDSRNSDPGQKTA